MILQIPLSHSVADSPLAVCDGSDQSDDDLITSDIMYKGRVLEIPYVRYNPLHRWYYFSRMSQDEVLVFKCYDTARDGRARSCLHSAFADPASPSHTIARESIEVRTVALFGRK